MVHHVKSHSSHSSHHSDHVVVPVVVHEVHENVGEFYVSEYCFTDRERSWMDGVHFEDMELAKHYVDH